MQHARRIALDIESQPDDTTCGPTCLQAVYRYFNDHLPLEQVIHDIVPLDQGGTLAVSLAAHALRRGYDATIYTYNLQLFDPTWFRDGRAVDIVRRLQAQRELKSDPKLAVATDAYLEFFELGGKLRFEDLEPKLLERLFDAETPVLTGLSGTYLYACAREGPLDYDDLGGEPAGHFVILCGYDREADTIRIADPLHDNPRYGAPYYDVDVRRLIRAILLGVLTYDANLLVLTPGDATP